MKFGVITAPRVAEVHEHDLFSIKPNEVLIRNKSCNICTTDYQQWKGLRPHRPVPMAFGHENSGVVVRVGDEVQNIREGDHVVVNIYEPCLECDNCRKGMNASYCMNRRNRFSRKNEFGYYGLYACGEYQVAQAKHVFKVDEDVPFEHAAFCEPTATVIHGIQRLRLQTGQKVLVIGAGTMGVLNSQVARYYGADVIISEVSEKKLTTVKSLGFEKLINVNEEDYRKKVEEFTKGKGPDAIIIAVGANKAYEQALEMAGKGCKLLIFASGYPAPSWSLDPNTLHYKLLNVIGTFGCSTIDYQIASELLNAKRIAVEALIEERYPLNEVQEAFEKATSPDAYRVSVVV